MQTVTQAATVCTALGTPALSRMHDNTHHPTHQHARRHPPTVSVVAQSRHDTAIGASSRSRIPRKLSMQQAWNITPGKLPSVLAAQHSNDYGPDDFDFDFEAELAGSPHLYELGPLFAGVKITDMILLVMLTTLTLAMVAELIVAMVMEPLTHGGV